MRLLVLFSFIAAVVPFMQRAPSAAAARLGALVWPETFEGRELAPREISEEEQRFTSGFPGKMARFTDGEREILFRAVGAPTRALHPSSDCFRGIGYSVRPLALRRDAAGAVWNCFEARGKRRLRVCERISAADGGSFSDYSSWYWESVLGRSRGPWIASTVVSTEAG